MKSKITFLMTLLAFLGCGKGGDKHHLSSLFADPNISLLTQEQVAGDKLAGTLGAFVRVFPQEEDLEEMSFAICSGIKISQHHILTAAHCQVKGTYFVWNCLGGSGVVKTGVRDPRNRGF